MIFTPLAPRAMRSRIGISFLTWAEDSPVRGAVKVPGGFRTVSEGAGRLLPLLDTRP